MEPKNQMQSDEIEIDLVELIGVLMSRLWMIIIFGALAGIITFLLCVYVITPKYESTTKMYIINRQSNETLTYSDLQTGTQLTKDYQELVTSRPVLDEVRSELSLDIDNKEHWIGEIERSDWRAGAFLGRLLRSGEFFDAVGEDSRVLLLTEGDELIAMGRKLQEEIRAKEWLTDGFFNSYYDNDGNALSLSCGS